VVVKVGVPINLMLGERGRFIGLHYFTIRLIENVSRVCRDVVFCLISPYGVCDVSFRDFVGVDAEEFFKRVVKYHYNNFEMDFKVRFSKALALNFSEMMKVISSLDVLHVSSPFLAEYMLLLRVLMDGKLNLPVLLTFHDLAPLIIPQCYSIFERTRWVYWKKFTGLMIKNVSKFRLFTAVSKNTKRDVVNFFNVDPIRIIVTYPGVESNFKLLTYRRARELLENVYGIPVGLEYFLYVGADYPRKNLRKLISAFLFFKKNLLRKDWVKLMIVGRISEKTKQCIQKSAVLRDELMVIPDVERRHLNAFYAGAIATCYLSLYEGFGLPVLEAMASGSPVIASNRASIPEVVGNSGILVDPVNIKGIALAMATIYNDEELRQNLIKRGLKRVKKFDWRETAQKFVKIYKLMAS